MLLVGHVPGCGKPFPKRNPAAVEYRPCRDRHFTTTFGARPSPHRQFANPLHPRISGRESRSAIATAPDTPRKTAHRQTRSKTPAMFPDTVDKLPEMTDQQPLYVESTVLRQLPHYTLKPKHGKAARVGPKTWKS